MHLYKLTTVQRNAESQIDASNDREISVLYRKGPISSLACFSSNWEEITVSRSIARVKQCPNGLVKEYKAILRCQSVYPHTRKSQLLIVISIYMIACKKYSHI